MNLEKAIILAVATHMGEVDKIGEPYIFHPIRVMQQFKDEDARITGVLHDVLEHNPKIRVCDVEHSAFVGPAIAKALDHLTRRPGEDYMDYIQRCGENGLAKRVKIADLFDNLDPSRTDRLDYQVFKRLNRKYKRALSVLL